MSEFSDDRLRSIISNQPATPEQIGVLGELMRDVVSQVPGHITSQFGYETESDDVLCIEAAYPQLGVTRPTDVSLSLMAPGFIDPPLVEITFTETDGLNHVTTGEIGADELYHRVESITAAITEHEPSLSNEELNILAYLSRFAEQNAGIARSWSLYERDESGRLISDQIRDLLQAQVKDFVVIQEAQQELDEGDITVRTYEHYGTAEGAAECPKAMLAVSDAVGFDREQIFLGPRGEHEYIAIDPINDVPDQGIDAEQAASLAEFRNELDDFLLPSYRADELIGELIVWRSQQQPEIFDEI